VLDVGCGNGGFLVQMKQMGFVVEGTEWSAQSAARVANEAGITIHVGDLLSLNLPEQSFDLITLWHVFEHLRDPHSTLQAIHRLLKPGGRLIMSMPNAESWQARRFGPHWFHHDPPRHLFAFGVQSLKNLLERDGFEIERISRWSLEQNPYGFVQSWLNARGYHDAACRIKGLHATSRGAFRTCCVGAGHSRVTHSLVERMRKWCDDDDRMQVACSSPLREAGGGVHSQRGAYSGNSLPHSRHREAGRVRCRTRGSPR
jgi:SAM-dependent methyltransferase